MYSFMLGCPNFLLFPFFVFFFFFGKLKRRMASRHLSVWGLVWYPAIKVHVAQVFGGPFWGTDFVVIVDHPSENKNRNIWWI